jgi:hypothetical protein
MADPDEAYLLGLHADLRQLRDDPGLEGEREDAVDDLFAEDVAAQAGVPQQIVTAVADQIAAVDELVGLAVITVRVAELGEVGDIEVTTIEPPRQ